MTNFIHATANLEKTTAFYRDIFGLAQPDPPIPPNPAAPDLIGIPGAQLQAREFRIPGEYFGWELTHFGGIDLKPGQAQVLDPGAADFIVEVRDMDPVLAAIRKVQSAMMSLTVSDMEATLSFYRDLLGFQVTGEMDFLGNQAVLDAGGSQFRQLTINVPNARIVFFESKGVPRTPFRLRVPDPGCPAITLLVADLDGLLNCMKAAGVKIVSTGGVPAQFTPQIRNIFVEDPDGFKIELDQVSQ